MHQINHKLLLVIASIAAGFISGFCTAFLTTDAGTTWRQFDHDTKYTYERISPDSVILTVCSTETLYVKSK